MTYYPHLTDHLRSFGVFGVLHLSKERTAQELTYLIDGVHTQASQAFPLAMEADAAVVVPQEHIRST